MKMGTMFMEKESEYNYKMYFFANYNNANSMQPLILM